MKREAPPHCPNIGPAGIARRRKSGVIFGVLGVVATIVMIVLDAPVGAVALTILPFTASTVGFMQARERT